MPPSTSISKDIVAYTTFDDLLASLQMPPPGFEYFRARRGLWLTPRFSKTSKSDISSAHEQLVEILRTPEAVFSDSCWRNGIEKVWNGLSKGARLKHGLPLDLAIKVVQASWIQDDTWPAGLQAPESDDDVLEKLLLEPMVFEHTVIKKSVPSMEPKNYTKPDKNVATLPCG